MPGPEADVDAPCRPRPVSQKQANGSRRLSLRDGFLFFQLQQRLFQQQLQLYEEVYIQLFFQQQ